MLMLKKARLIFIISFILVISFISTIYSNEIPDTIKVRIQIDNTTARVNDRIVSLDAPPKIMNNRTYVPIRFISEAFGAKVDWDSVLRMVTITLDNPEFYFNESIQKEVEINTLKEQIISKDNEIKNLNIEIKKKDAEIKQLKADNSNLKTDITNLQNTINGLKTEIENLKNGGSVSEIERRNTKIFIDGKAFPLKSEVFIYKDKVYASLEEICPALKIEFKWDEQNNIFYIGSSGEKQPPNEDNDIGKRVLSTILCKFT